MSLLERVRRRKLAQWSLAYAAAAFAVVQGLDLVATRFGWSGTVGRVLIIVAFVGFFVALLLAWYHGERGAQRASGTELALLVLLLAIGGGLAWKYGPESAQPGSGPLAAAPSIAKSIAVLPFENLSGDADNAYFASGMQDMILTKLAAIGELKVISRTSTEKYASHPDDLKTIAQQLGVATILEGSVQKRGNAVLINVQLIDAASDHHLWAEAYPRTLDNLFGVEGEVAQKVADALKAKLSSAETVSVASVPTQNAAAYEWFLKAEYRGEQARQTWDPATYREAEAEFLRAIELDPGFALAHAKLALCQLRRHWFATRLSPEELSAVKASIDRALALAPELPDAHLALAFYHYWGFRDYDAATVAFERTLQLSPNRVEAITGPALIARRTGRIQQSLAHFERALSLSPRDPLLLGETGWTYVLLRRYEDADRQLRQALAIAPADANAIDALELTRLFGFGDVAGTRELMRAPPDWRIAGADGAAGDIVFLINPRVYAEFFDRRYADALRAWADAPVAREEERRAARVARVVIGLFAGDKAAQADCRELQPLLTADLAKQPDSLSLLQKLSWVEVCLGRNAQALAAAQKAVDVLPIGRDSYFGAYQLVGLAQIAAHAGAPDRAIEVIRELLSMPAGTVISSARLELDPVWDPLRQNPRFQALIADAKSAQAKGTAPHGEKD